MQNTIYKDLQEMMESQTHLKQNKKYIRKNKSVIQILKISTAAATI